MKSVYEEYKREHPEELEKINALFSISEMVEERRAARRAEKIRKIEKWRKIKNGEYSK